MIRYLPALLAVVLAGCTTVGPDYKRPQIDTPRAWPDQTAAPAKVPDRWWTLYGDAVLDALVDEALRHNTDIAQAVARVDEARAQLKSVDADRYPRVGANASAYRYRASEKSALWFPGFNPYYRDYAAELTASWEIDLWGRVRRATEAARADVATSEADRDAVRLVVAASVARGYFTLRALDAQVDLTRRTLETRLEGLKLQQLRYTSGVSSEYDLRQIEADTEAARALLPDLERTRAQQENALAVLLGRSPRAIVERHLDIGAAIEALTVPPAVPAGLPSDLLERRPDIREAEQQLVSANARIGLARAAYFPTLSLTGALGTESAGLSDLFSAPARLWSFGTSAAATIFDAGRIAAGVEAAQARQRQLLAAYQASTQNAFREVLDALVAQRKSKEVLDAEQARVKALKQAYDLAKMRYDSGVASLLDLLDAERNLLNADLSRIDAQRAQLAASADLFKALGGGWQNPDKLADIATRGN
ncbi:MAG TPA: efflux transporter outer membrane subunit [Burkholderiales bacterium]|nr:efflux transporter outer membrane subunit [Burkholderiales bacterium]